MWRWCLWLLVCAACEPVPATSLEEIDFPPGFRLDTTVEVRLTVDAPDGHLVVRSPDGVPLYDGSVTLARRGVLLRVPAGTDHVVAAVTGLGDDRPVDVPVEALAVHLAWEAP